MRDRQRASGYLNLPGSLILNQASPAETPISLQKQACDRIALMSFETLYRSRLFLRLFASTAVVLCLSFAGVYFLAVPYLQATVERREAESARAILEIAYEQLDLVHHSLERYRARVLAEKRQQLRSLIKALAVRADVLDKQVRNGRLTPALARQMLLEEIARTRPGKDEYVFTIGHDRTVLSHPEPAWQGQDAAKAVDPDGIQVAHRTLDLARAEGEGFFTYRWPRLGESKPVEKMAFVMDIPAFRMAIATALFIGDIDGQVDARRNEFFRELRVSLNKIRIARTGYLYIYDRSGILLSHPSPSLEGRSVATIIDRRSSKPILDILNASSDATEPARYIWDMPSDPGNFAYEKVAWVRYQKALDWHIAASVYQDELNETAITLRNRMLGVLSLLLAVALGLVFLLSRRMTAPLKQLLDTTRQVTAGDLAARSPLVQPDEIGAVSDAFNAMLDRLQSVVARLDDKNQVLNATVGQLQRAMDELHITQDRLARTQRLAALGIVVDGIAHELNTPLGIAVNTASLINAKVLKLAGQIETGIKRSELTNELQQLQEAAELLERNLHRAAGLIENFKDMSIDTKRHEHTRFALDTLVAGLCLQAAPNLPPQLTLSHDIPPGLTLEGYPELLKQVILQLIDNARQHGFEARTAGSICLSAKTSDTGGVDLSIRDDGIGIAPEIMDRIFDPFFTTKMGRGGTGIGLSTVHNIVTIALGGDITADSAPGRGSTFILHLPLRTA